MLENFLTSLWRHYDVISAKNSPKWPFLTVFGIFFEFIFTLKGSMVPKFDDLVKNIKNTQFWIGGLVSDGVTRAKNGRFWGKISKSLIAILKVLLWSNFKFRVIFRKLKRFSFPNGKVKNSISGRLQVEKWTQR